ncbi:hypothetical protein RBB76_14080 [Tunturiibacter psychrotolerans]|uniref:hypothetical protein n=2 Tax=Tunturiibacter psychrotolerans TaxID=3069686 RepID=UPI003D9AFDBF
MLKPTAGVGSTPMTLLDADIKRDPVVGEDTWDLFEAIECSFGIDLGDYRSHCGRTIRDLAADVGRLTKYPSADKCLTAITFYRLRRALQQFGFPRSTVRPATPVRKLLPWRNRRMRWQQMRDQLGLELPGLLYPRWALLLALFGPVTILGCMKTFWGIPLSVASILGLSVLLVIPAIFASIPFARTLPPGSDTCGGLAEVILARNYAAIATENGSRRGAEVLWALRQLVATEMVMNIEQVSPDARIPQDLNIY